MVAASFLMADDIGKILAIVGLTLLNIEAIFNRAINLISLNTLSIAGFIYALYL